MSLFQRPFEGLSVSVSISESDEAADRGFPTWQVNRLTLQIVSALIGQGASVLFGHDWREDGIMQAVYGFAQQVQPSLTEVREGTGRQPLLRNFLAWPDVPYLSNAEREELSSTLQVEEAKLPQELRGSEPAARAAGRSSRLHRYLRARSLTDVRERLTSLANARLCIGGRKVGFEGRYPGIVEEALFSVRQGKPLYLVGFLGGAARQVIRAINGENLPEDPDDGIQTNNIYRDPPIGEVLDRQNNGDDVWREFNRIGLRAIAESNGLTEDENAELFRTPVIDKVIHLLLTGLSRISNS
jgi:hypothetical protein